MNHPAYVLAGGRSSRLGRDKARARIDGEKTVLEATIEPLRGLFSSWTAVADRRDKFDDLGLRTIADHQTHRGPLGGILRAADDAGRGYFFVTSCDRLGLRRRWVRRLAGELEARPPAVSFVFEGRREPLFAFYGAELADPIRRRLEAGQAAVWRLLDDLDAATVDAPEGWSETFCVNTPEQLRRARQWVASSS